MSDEGTAPGSVDLLAVGKILRPHGIRGALVVEALSDWPERFSPGAKLLLEKAPGDYTEVTLEVGQPHGGRILMSIEGVGDRNEAEELKGLYLMVPACDAAPLGEDEYWAHDLVGMQVVEEQGGKLGDVAEVICRPAQDLLVVETEDGSEFSVPLVKEFVKDVDTTTRVITVALVEGMAP